MTRKKRTATGSGSVSFLLLKQQRQVGAAQFKAHCLEILDEVERTGAQITVTKHRKPVALVVPVAAREARPFCGSMKGRVESAEDVMSPIDADWTADAGNLT